MNSLSLSRLVSLLLCVCVLLTFSKGFLNLFSISRQVQVCLPSFQVPNGAATSCHDEPLNEEIWGQENNINPQLTFS